MARAASKSKKRPAPKPKKVENKEEEVDIKDEEHQEHVDSVSDAADKKGRGRPASKAKKAASTKKPAARGRSAASSSGRKSGAKKEEEKDDSSKDDAEYEVEKILSMRKVKGGRQFLIKWKGYTSRKATWEREENLHCDDLLKEFLEKKLAVPKETQRYVDTADLKYEGSSCLRQCMMIFLGLCAVGVGLLALMCYFEHKDYHNSLDFVFSRLSMFTIII